MKFQRILQFFLTLIAIGFILFRLRDSGFSFHSSITLNSPLFLYLVWLLMPLNWWLETKKWQKQINFNQAVTVKSAAREVYNGLLFSLFMPFRIGESFGRSFDKYGQVNKEKFGISVLNSQLQNLVIVAFGLPALVALEPNVWNIATNYVTEKWLWVLCLTLVLILFMYLALRFISRLFPKSLNTTFNQFKQREILQETICYTVIRYLVFIFQLAFLIWAFVGVDTAIIGLSMVYFMLLTLSPALTVGKIGIREGIAVWVFSTYHNLSAEIAISAVFLLWAINIAAPVVVMSVTNWARSLGFNATRFLWRF